MTNVEDNIVFSVSVFLILYYSQLFYISKKSISHFGRETANENKQS